MADMSGNKENQGLGLTAKNMTRMLPTPMKRDDGTAAMAQVAAEELERRGRKASCPSFGGSSTGWPVACWIFWPRT